MSVASIFGNTALSLFKLIAGILGNSGAMVSDAVHSFSDVATTLIAWIGTKVSRKEADTEHPYGHDRVESVASLGLGGGHPGDSPFEGRSTAERTQSGYRRVADRLVVGKRRVC